MVCVPERKMAYLPHDESAEERRSCVTIASVTRRDIVDRDDRLRELEEKYEGYEVYDNAGEKIGKVDDLFIDQTGREEYIGVKMGLFGLSGKTLIPMEIARVDEQERRIEVEASKDQVKNAPHYSDEDDIDHEFEARIREYFGLESQEPSLERGTYGRYSGATVGQGDAISGTAGATSPSRGIEDRGLVGRETNRDRGDLGTQRGRTATARDEVGGADERPATEPLDAGEETGDVPVDQPVVLVRVRRVYVIEE
jgi:sporulation protein YlmC with PRC-barrel domain